MPCADFFARLGLFVARGFFDPVLCRTICNELGSAPEELATVGKEGILDPSVRSARLRKASRETRCRVNARFEELRPVLARHFGVLLTDYNGLQFLCYNPGDFYTPHRDGDDDLEAPAYMRDRKVSAVLFLNPKAERPEPGTYGGGSLTFYGLVQDARWQSFGFGLDGEEGLLIAFRSDLRHEVTPVAHGQRYSLVTWYC